MKAILINDDRSLRWDSVADPVMGEEECLVRIEAAGVNRADLLQREGSYPPPPGCPDWMGLEIAGTVTAVGSKVTRWKVGDEVCALLGGGGYAQAVSVHQDMMMPIPQGCTMAEAAALPEAFATAYLNLFLEGGIRPGNTLLVTGGNSGLASVIIPLARSYGIRVITTVRSPEKAAAIAHLNADLVVDTSRQDLEQVLMAELAAFGGVDVAIDCLGGENMGRYLHCLKHGARWIVIAALSGQHTQIDLRNIYVRNVRIVGSTLRSRTPAVKAQILNKLMEEVWPKVASGEVKPTIFAQLPMDRAEEAQQLLYDSKSAGKIVLTRV